MTETARIDQVTGEFERKGTCAVCGKAVTRTKTIKAPTYDEMIAGGDRWGRGPLAHAGCESELQVLVPSRWATPSGKVHHRRLRFWVGTKDEVAASIEPVITLCGKSQRDSIRRVPDSTPVDCGVCVKAANTRAHLS